MQYLSLAVGQYQINPPAQIQPLTNLNLQSLLSYIISLILPVAVILAFIFVLIAGLKWMMSQGDKKAVEEARKTLTFAIAGLIIIFASFFLLNLISYALNVPLIGTFQ
jgi:hypothetical protein